MINDNSALLLKRYKEAHPRRSQCFDSTAALSNRKQANILHSLSLCSDDFVSSHSEFKGIYRNSTRTDTGSLPEVKPVHKRIADIEKNLARIKSLRDRVVISRNNQYLLDINYPLEKRNAQGLPPVQRAMPAEERSQFVGKAGTMSKNQSSSKKPGKRVRWVF